MSDLCVQAIFQYGYVSRKRANAFNCKVRKNVTDIAFTASIVNTSIPHDHLLWYRVQKNCHEFQIWKALKNKSSCAHFLLAPSLYALLDKTKWWVVDWDRWMISQHKPFPCHPTPNCHHRKYHPTWFHHPNTSCIGCSLHKTDKVPVPSLHRNWDK